MVKWSQKHKEIFQIITADGETFDLSTGSDVGNWVIESSGFGMPSIDYIAQQGPFQHGETVRDYRLKPRIITLSLRQQACDRDNYWARRTELLNCFRPNRDPVGLTGSWIARSQYQYDSEVSIYSLAVFNNRLYGGTYNGGKLFRWDDADRWYLVADTLNAQTYIPSLVVFDDGGGVDELYGTTGIGARLFKWNGTDAWAQVCARYATDTIIWCSLVFDDGVIGETIFAGTENTGQLIYYNVGGAAWAQAAPQAGGAETIIMSLAIFDDGTGSGERLYGGSYPHGKLYRYNPAGGPPGVWVEVCAQYHADTSGIRSLKVYNGQLYAGTSQGGRLLRYDVSGGQWEQVADGAPAITWSLEIFQGRLYLVGTTGQLYRWDGTSALETITDNYQSNGCIPLIVYNNRLFAGSYNDGAYLLEYIRRAGETSLPCATLRRLLSTGEIRDICVYIDNGPIFTPPRTGWDEFGISEVIRLYAPDPTFYDPEEDDSGSYATAYLLDEDGHYILQEDGSKIELEDGSFEDGTAEECRYIEYTGTWETHPTFIITGPIDNPIIRNESTDEYIELDYNVSSGEIVTIVLTPGNQSVSSNLYENLIGVVTPESNMQSFHIAPHPEVEDGMNQICIYGTGTDGDTDFSFTYYTRYIGI